MPIVGKERQPDVAFVATAHLPASLKGNLPVALDLVVEVISKNDRYEKGDEKVDEYLAAGSRLIWVVRPRRKIVEVYRASKPYPTLLTPDDELDGFDVVPGFKLAVHKLFE